MADRAGVNIETGRGRDPEPRPGETLHVTNGGSAAGTLRSTSLGGAVLSWDDVLCEGPLPAVTTAELRQVRARFLNECGWGARREIVDALERRDHLFELALREGRSVVLWFEHDLYDQLQLLQVLAQATELGFDSDRLDLLNVGPADVHPDFHGLGELTPDKLESLWPLRRPVTPDLAALARSGWAAVRSPEPGAVELFLDSDTSALPFVRDALHRLLEELPDSRNGLARSERQILEALANGPRTPGQVFRESRLGEEAPYDGDARVWRRLASLGRGDRPLVGLEEGGPLPAPPPLGDGRVFAAASVVLTADGRAVLEERADLVELLGLDRWMGGTHLTTDRSFRWDRRSGRIV